VTDGPLAHFHMVMLRHAEVQEARIRRRFCWQVPWRNRHPCGARLDAVVPALDRRAPVMAPVPGHVRSYAGGDVMADGADHVHSDALLAHDRGADIDQALGVAELRRRFEVQLMNKTARSSCRGTGLVNSALPGRRNAWPPG
jgi:hypothetical protein